VVALNETIRIMQQIDDVIEAHGGWPDAFKVAVAADNGEQGELALVANREELK
jgi:hypothetical protein